MNNPVTSKEEIISVCRMMVEKNGISSVNMRSIASECNISVGSLYNYFSSKSDLLCAAVEGIWQDIFNMHDKEFIFCDFIECLSWLFKNIDESSKKYPEFFTRHSSVFSSEDKSKANRVMNKYIEHIKDNLILVLKNDSSVREDAFRKYLSMEVFVDFIFNIFISNSMTSGYDYNSIIELADRYIH